eukprot:m.485570 g.485570  ORF g.485570 m.485570 type:complete len:540 (-) comp23873_c0_seq1:49-1668(-)
MADGLDESKIVGPKWADQLEKVEQEADVKPAQTPATKQTDAELSSAVAAKLTVDPAAAGAAAAAASAAATAAASSAAATAPAGNAAAGGADVVHWKDMLGKEVKDSLLIEVDAAQIKVQQADPRSPLFSAKSWDELATMAHLQKIPPGVLQAIHELEFTKPSKIQESAIPLLLKNPQENLIFQSQAGTGKTAAFVITILSRVVPAEQNPQAIVVSPTKELAQQIKTVVESLAKHTPIKTICVYGGMDRVNPPIVPHVVVATPGKLADFLKPRPVHKRFFDPAKIRVLVIDEADQMIDSGFRDKMIAIKKPLSGNLQMILLSATFEDHLMTFAETYVPAPVNKIVLPKQEVSVENVKQMFIVCQGDAGKFAALEAIYDNVSVGQTIIFAERKNTARQLQQRLQGSGHACSLLLGDMQIAEREQHMDRFRAGTDKVLIATNVLARGIDVRNISMVVNYDIPIKFVSGDYFAPCNPADPDTYLHRIGRTGRFGKKGSAITLIDANQPIDFQRLQAISAHWGREIQQLDPTDEDGLEKNIAAT